MLCNVMLHYIKLYYIILYYIILYYIIVLYAERDAPPDQAAPDGFSKRPE